MFRICLIVCVSLIFGITAKPWSKLTGEAFQDAVLSIDSEGKMSWKVEVEPPEDMDEIHYDIDPRMKIWKSMTGGRQENQFQKPEEDLDKLYHPSMEDLQVQMMNQNAVPAADIQPLKEDANVKYSLEAEEDRDDIYHPAFIQVDSEEPEQDWNGMRSESEVRIHSKPEEDMDDLYHKDYLLPVAYGDNVRAPVYLPSETKYSEPEEDLDDLYHP